MTDLCVVMGNGPSLKGFDFHRLDHVTTLGMNAAYRYWDQIGWYPTYYCCLDDQLIKTHHVEIERLYARGQVKSLFVHGSFFEFHPHRLGNRDFTSFDQTDEFLHHQNAKGPELEPLYDHPAFQLLDASKITTGSHSVRYVAYKGHTRIALMGIDLRYVEIIPEAERTEGLGLKIKETPKSNPNYFFDGYQKTGDLFNIPNPDVHDGDLHPRSFQWVPIDFEKNNVKAEVVNCNAKSVLSDRDIFPYKPIETVLNECLLGAVVVPTNAREIDDILNNFWIWSQRDHHPTLETASVAAKSALVFAFNNDEGRKHEDLIRKTYDLTGMDRFFRGVFFEYLDLTGDRDIYERDYKKTVGETGFKAGPNNQFFETMRRVSGYGKYSFLMETDCLPIRRGWLSHLQNIVTRSEPFWILGSAYRGLTKLSKTYLRHINGNAVYASGVPDFQEFLADFWEPQTWRLVRDQNRRLAYDCILEVLFSEETIREADFMAVWQRSAHRMRYTDYIQNISGDLDIVDVSEQQITDIRRESPNTFLVHNRALHKIVAAKLTTPPAQARGEAVASAALLAGRQVLVAAYPRLLIIDMTAMGNATATGEIKANLLRGWPAERLLQVASPGHDRLQLVRPEVGDGVGGYTTVDATAPDIRKVIADFAPHVILYRPLADHPHLHSFAMSVITASHARLVTWIMDDWPARLQAEDPARFAILDADLRQLLGRSVVRLSISEAMSTAFAARYGQPFQAFANGIDPALWTRPHVHADGPVLVRYAGGLAPDMNAESVQRIAQAVEKLAASGHDIRFEISTRTWWAERSGALFEGLKATRLDTETRPFADYITWLCGADVAVIAYNFDEASLRYVRYSMANKLPECLASGAALLAHGPRGVATIDYLAGSGAAVIVDQPSGPALEAALTDLLATKTRAALGKAAQALAFQRHNLPILTTELARILVSAAQPPRAKPSPVTGTPVTMPITPPRPAIQLFADGKPLAAQPLSPDAAHAHLATAGVTGLMLYANPRRVIAARIAKGADPLVALQDWQAETAAHLALYRQHRARLVLVEAEAAAAAPAAVLAAVQALAARADVSTAQALVLPSAFLPAPDPGPPDPVLLVLAGQILREDLPAARLFAECQASALALPGATPDQPVSADVLAAVAAYRAQLAAAASGRKALAEAQSRAATEAASAATRSGDLARDLAAAQQKLAQQAAALAAEQAASRDRAALQAEAVKSLETRLADATGKAAAAHLLQPQLAQLRLTAEAYHAEVAAHREMFAGMERDLQDLRARLTAQGQAREAAVEALGLRNGLLDEASRRRVALEIALAGQQTLREADAEVIAALTRDRDAAQAELDEVFRSHSWLVTAPMRSLRRGITPKS